MTNNKTTYVLEIDAEIDSLKREIDQAKKALTGLGDSPFGKGLEKKFGTILSQIDKLQKKASQPITSKSTFDSLEKGFGDVVVDAKNLLKEMQSIRQLSNKEKISLLPPDEAKRLREAINAVQDYERAIDRLERKRVREFESAKISKSETTSKLNTAKESQKTARQSLSAATGKGSAYGDAQALIQQAEAAKKAKKEIKELDKQIADYRSELEELKKLESLTEDQKGRAATLRKNISSLAGQKGAKTKLVNAGPDETQLTAARNTVAEQAPAIEALEKAAKEADAEVTRLENSLAKLNEKINNNSESITQSQSDYKVMYEQAKKLGVSLEGVTEDVNPQNIQILTTRLKEMVNEGLLPIDSAADEVQHELEELGAVAQTTGDKIAQSSEKFDALTENNNRINNLKQTVAQFIGWTGATKALSAAMRNAFQDIKELDAAMTEIAVVTDFDIGDMWDQLPTYTARANELGLSITEVYEASALFYQQGLDTNEMVALSNETLKMAKIAGLSAADATDRMTAALRGFNMELDEASAQKVADVYSELAAITASDVDEISSAMTKTASIASSAGMEFETTAAFLSQIIETTRESAETAGTAMKTVIARFQELKKDPSEMGEVDGEMIDANAIETALRSVGVSLRDASGQFRELDDVFLELSSKWDSLDKNTQRYIATIAAGSRQQSRFIAMMSDYERTQELVTAANNSAGASQRQYEKTLESLKTKLKRLENAWTEFSTGLMNSDFVKFAVDLLTNILNMLNQATKGFNSFTSSLTKIGTLVAIFQLAKTVVNKFFNEIVTTIYQSAYQAGENIAKGVSDGINKNSSRRENRLFGYTQMSNGVKDFKNARSIRTSEEGIRKGSDEEAAKWQIQHNTLLKLKNDLEKDGIKNKEKYKECLMEIEDSEESRIYSAEELADMEKKAFQEIAAGASVAAQAITLVGAGINVVGQMFTNAGFEEAGETISAIGTGLTIIGSVLMALVPIISLLGTTITVAGEKISIAGYMAQTGWWPLLVIMLAIAAVIAIVVVTANAIKKASPEYKLEKAQEAADKAADAADRAAEAYENLKDSFEGLENGYKALEDLTKGTEEWNDAVREINNSVLDLIAKYPELAKFVDNEGGVLTLDVNDENVQAVLNQAKNDAVMANSSATMANVNLAKAEDNLAYNRLDDNAKFDLNSAKAAGAAATGGAVLAGAGAGAGIGALVGTVVPVIGNAVGAAVGAVLGGIGGLIGGIFTGKAAKDAALEDTQTTTEALAKAIADGAIVDDGSGYKVMDEEKLNKYGVDKELLDEYYAEVGDSTEALRDFGNQLLETQRQEDAAFAALAASAYSLADVLNMSDEEKAQASSVVDDATTKKIYDEKLAALGDTDFTSDDDDSGDMSESDKQIRDQAIKKHYGAEARIEGDTVTFRDAEGKQQTETLTSDEIKAIIANQQTVQETTGLIEIAPAVVDEVVDRTGLTSIEKATMDQEGGNLTKAEAEELASAGSTEKLKQAWEKLGDTEQAVFGSYEDYLEKTQGAAKIAMGDFDKLEARAQEAGIVLDETFTTDLAKGFIQKMEDVFEISGTEGVQKIQKEYDALFSGVDNEEKKAEITALMNGMDWADAEDLLSLRIQLKEVYGLEADAVDNMVDAMAEGAEATSSLGATVQVFGDFYHATEKVNAALRETSDLQWEYERLLKGGGSTKDLSKNLEEQWNSILRTGNEAMAAHQAAQEDQVRRQASGANIRSIIGTSASDYLDIDEETGIYDLTRLQEQIDAGHFGKEGSKSYEAITKYIEDLKEGNTTMQEQLDVAKDAYEQLEEIKEQAEESYWDLYDQVSEAIIGTMEKELEIQQDLLAATEEANAKLLDKMQQQIDEDRQAREQEKTEKEINELRSQAKFLSMETSGVNLLQLLDLEKQIEEAEEGYRDSLIDQALQNLSDANDKMIEQGERQINIAEQQLAAFEKSDQFSAMITSEIENFKQQIKDGVDVEDTTLGEKLKTYQETYWDNPGAQADFWKNLNGIGAQITTVEELINGTKDSKDGSITDLLNKIEQNTDTSELLNYFAKGEYESANQQNNTTKDVYGVSFENEENTYDTDASGKVQLDDKGAPIINYAGTRAEDYKSDMTKINALSTGDSGTKVKAAREQATNITNRGTSTILGGTAQEALNAVHALGNESAYYSSSDFTYEDELALRDAYASGEVNPTGAWHTQVNNKYQAFDEAWRNAAHEKIKEIALDYRRDGFESAWSNETIQKIISEGNQFFPDGIIEGGSRFSGQDYVLSILTTDLKNQYETEGGWATVDADGDEYHTNGIGSKISKPLDWEYFGMNGVSSISSGYTVDGKEYPVTWDSTIPINPPDELNALNPQDGWVASRWTGYGYMPIIYRGQHNYGAPPGWYGAMAGSTDLGKALAFKNFFGGEQFRKSLGHGPMFKTGGLADFTGPAWLDGTKSKPEIVLNQRDSANFIMLRDILQEAFSTGANTPVNNSSTQTSGDNHFEIEINVEKLENDYDVDKLANKIRSMIYEDATYRNVNAVGMIR